MAKTLNILKAGNSVPFADNGLKLSKSIKISEIEYHDDFKFLFTIDEVLLHRIKDSILDNKYDNSQPVHIWIVTDENGIVHKYLIDGHTRVKAAELAGLETVPYYEHKFESFEEAYKYVLGLQVNRRNLAGSELLRNISILYGTDFIQNYEGKKSEAMAEVLGVSDRTVEKGIFVQEHADEDTLAKIDSDELTVNKAYNQLKGKEKNNSKTSNDIEEISDSLENTSENPRPISFLQQKETVHKLTPEEDNERTKERRDSYLKGLSEGFYKAVVFCCSEFAKGKTAEEVYNDERIADTSPYVICNFQLPADAEDIISKW